MADHPDDGDPDEPRDPDSGELVVPGTSPLAERPADVAVTGWGRVESSPRQRRKRITLEVMGPPLALPDAADSTPIEALSAEISLPELERRSRAAPIPPAPALPAIDVPETVDDGWGRSRPLPSPAPRPRASTPPPFDAAAGLGLSDAIALVATRSRPPAAAVVDLATEMVDRFALGDFSGALLAAELVLGKEPHHVEAKKCAASCRDRLAQLHLSRLGGATRVPRVAVDGSEVRWLGLDHRAGFLLSHVDGASTVDELVDLSGMARHEALKILVELLDAGALKF